MAKTTFILPYNTDSGAEVFIKWNIFEESSSALARLSLGGWTTDEVGACVVTMPRRILKPRYVQTKLSGEIVRVYVRNLTVWVSLIKSTNISGYAGESASNCGSQMFANVAPDPLVIAGGVA